MFDADTVALMASAPRLEGLDLADLPRRLTDAFAEIVSARIRLRQRAAAGRALPEAVEAIVKEMRRLAFSHEALVGVSPERENRAGAAFVAGAAHHVTLLADRVGPSAARPTLLGPQEISPEVSATLLFLIAEASADAAEMAKTI
ncbi:hypothetical protein NLY43_25470 [Mesorhizobium sp. C416B]|uniref:hypothetical protein n=1 Tax=unclassified Mesorhizobium TaxID=325217 RepID=UPI0012EBBED5|nr:MULTISPECIES: hypothetical protein [unclassified Mesorhizobium]WJI61924.1 hypothetical protein NLY43_25470 [Mesorhizobium sp. C416B]